MPFDVLILSQSRPRSKALSTVLSRPKLLYTIFLSPLFLFSTTARVSLHLYQFPPSRATRHTRIDNARQDAR